VISESQKRQIKTFGRSGSSDRWIVHVSDPRIYYNYIRAIRPAENSVTTYEPVLSTHARCYSPSPMEYQIYVDGKHVATLGSASGWDAAATWIEKRTADRTPLRRLAELGETYQPEEAAAMLSDLLKDHKPRPEIAHTLQHLHRFLTGGHVVILYDVIDEP
jgi:hypothetical protein